MDVVDLTDGVRKNDTSPTYSTEVIEHTGANQHPAKGLQSKLGPQAAAALQASAKRKLPESLRTLPAKPKQSKRQTPTPHSTARPAVPPAIRQPAVRISANLPANSQASMPLAHSSQPPANLQDSAGPAEGAAAVAPALQNSIGPVLEKPASQATNPQRRMPDSLIKLGSSSATSQSKGTAARNVSATVSNKVGTSEHDTKVGSCRTHSSALTSTHHGCTRYPETFVGDKHTPCPSPVSNLMCSNAIIAFVLWCMGSLYNVNDVF